MQFEVTRNVVEAMRKAAETAYPLEACGILLGEGNRVSAFLQARNVHLMPEAHFEIDPQILINAHREARLGGLQLLGYFHSHPRGNARPSETDKRSASGDGRIWVIMGDGEITFSKDEVEGFQSLPYSIIDD